MATLLLICLAAAPVLADDGTDTKPGDEHSTFSHTLEPRRGAVQVEIDGYRATIGGAEKSIDECLKASEGSSTPPSCLSGLTVQPKPPE